MLGPLLVSNQAGNFNGDHKTRIEATLKSNKMEPKKILMKPWFKTNFWVNGDMFVMKSLQSS